jgi:hypothetical protein
MLRLEAIELTNNSKENNFIAKRAEQSYTNIYTLASNLCYTNNSNYESAQLGNTAISLF